MYKALICGTNYGANYLPALSCIPTLVKTVGILSQGSLRSFQLAHYHRLPHFTSPDEIRADTIDLAIIATGGKAALDLSMEFMMRGIHILAEHPMEPDDIQACHKNATDHGVRFHINTHFPDLDVIQNFLTTCATLKMKSAPRFILVTCNPRTLYSSIDIIVRLLQPEEDFQLRGEKINTAEEGATLAGRFESIHIVLAGVSCTFQVQGIVSEQDDGSATFVHHQIQVGFPEGNVMLCETFGPVLWMPQPTRENLSVQSFCSHLDTPPPTGSLPYSLGMRERANQRAVGRLCHEIQTGQIHPTQRRTHQLLVSNLFSEIRDRIGKLDLVDFAD